MIYVYIGAAAIVLAFMIYETVTSKKRLEKKLLRLVRRTYGNVPEREYTDEDIRKLRVYFEHTRHEDAFSIDDITWNDLGMDDLYAAVNHTFSSAGEEVLYALFREPCFDEEELRERDRLAVFFRENPEIRESMSMDYASVGRTRKYSLVEFLDSFRDLELKPTFHYLYHLLLLVLAIIGSVFAPGPGIISLIFVIIFNIVTYYREKSMIEPYYVSLSAVSYLTKAGLRIAKHREGPLEKYADDLSVTLKPLKKLEKSFKWLGQGGANISTSILSALFEYFLMMTHLDFLVFNRMVRIVRNHEEEILRMVRTLGYLEAMIAVASFRERLPFYCTGEFLPGTERSFLLTDAYHPLLENPVANSIDTDTPVLITGSNASGKSTFLRVSALSALFAETIATVPAHAYRAPMYRIYSSMALTDNLLSGESYYIVEIRSIKRILDACSGDVPVLLFVDEVLRGTNTVERIAASSEILKVFAEKRAFVFAATHDIELTYILEGIYLNYHFEEEIIDGNVVFNYILKQGRSETRNAIRLLSVMGYDPEVTEAAQRSAERFTKEGVWRL
ncbi:MAG: hypothetical protein IJL78_06330 [Lachnospiraceae bacterium]|nr:hypothetical protein [Lachnospiraceae bacterium]